MAASVCLLVNSPAPCKRRIGRAADEQKNRSDSTWVKLCAHEIHIILVVFPRNVSHISALAVFRIKHCSFHKSMMLISRWFLQISIWRTRISSAVQHYLRTRWPPGNDERRRYFTSRIAHSHAHTHTLTQNQFFFRTRNETIFLHFLSATKTNKMKTPSNVWLIYLFINVLFYNRHTDIFLDFLGKFSAQYPESPIHKRIHTHTHTIYTKESALSALSGCRWVRRALWANTCKKTSKYDRITPVPGRKTMSSTRLLVRIVFVLVTVTKRQGNSDIYAENSV